MSTPGGWGSNPYGQPQHNDPTGGNPQGQGSSGMQYQGFGSFQQPPQSTPGGFPAQPQAGGFPGQQPGFGQPPGCGPPPRRGRGSLIAAIAIAAVAVIAIATTIVVLVTNSGGGQAAPTPVPTKPPASTNAPQPTKPVTGPPVVPGWQVVPVPRRTALYDAPLEWWVDNPDNTHGFGPVEDPITMSGVSIYQPGFCPEDTGSFRAMAGASARKGPDDATVATETAQKLVQLAYTVNGKAPQVQFSPPTPVQIHGGRTATQITATVTHPAPGPCDSPTVHVTVLATNSDGQTSVVFMSVGDQGVPGAIPPATLEKMASTIRPDH